MTGWLAGWLAGWMATEPSTCWAQTAQTSIGMHLEEFITIASHCEPLTTIMVYIVLSAETASQEHVDIAAQLLVFEEISSG